MEANESLVYTIVRGIMGDKRCELQLTNHGNADASSLRACWGLGIGTGWERHRQHEHYCGTTLSFG